MPGRVPPRNAPGRGEGNKPTGSFPRPKVISSSGEQPQHVLGSLRPPFIEDGAHSLAIESQTESVLRRKLGDFFFPVFLVYRPNAFQVLVANHAMPPFAMHPFFDLFR